ncbi:DUF305 domain-containing protein [Nocardia gipuzkoensis]|uniref:DUF305 domain-containing protein n=1 Tax=Nocardia gipuzkoensis TaxID=2749991 RepID=UPI001E319B2B|nr:DUF305 domain-containing protein [Nocardia gipuzkoensis]UGT70922.1 DUF305 domain-containing protein [Nocardia gipuzkoensis]
MPTRSTGPRWFAAVAGAVMLALTGCGDDQEDHGDMPGMTSATAMSEMPGMSGTAHPQTGTRSDYNDADVTFLQMMYPHHAQAMQMAELVATRSQDTQVQELAQQIRTAQEPEMQQISSLLQQFGKQAPSAHPGTMGAEMPGMAAPQALTELQGMSGKEFDRMFLTMMIEHHTGAIEMARTEQANGVNPEARKIADSVVSTQQAEIDRMRAMLAQP